MKDGGGGAREQRRAVSPSGPAVNKSVESEVCEMSLSTSCRFKCFCFSLLR